MRQGSDNSCKMPEGTIQLYVRFLDRSVFSGMNESSIMSCLQRLNLKFWTSSTSVLRCKKNFKMGLVTSVNVMKERALFKSLWSRLVSIYNTNSIIQKQRFFIDEPVLMFSSFCNRLRSNHQIKYMYL